MRVTVILLALLGCGTKTAARSSETVDILTAGSAGESDMVTGDLNRLIDAKRGQLSKCADPVRALVREHDRGWGRVGILVHAIGARGGHLTISAWIDKKFPPAFDRCVEQALRSPSSVVAADDYDVYARLHLCVRPEAP
ncbi:MAG TPA: hypothetical protein VN253_19935 [Kofleriaceae bacterium]|nr:hypothetical protein [Kofleriaceae bacterium]